MFGSFVSNVASAAVTSLINPAVGAGVPLQWASSATRYSPVQKLRRLTYSAALS